MQHGRSGRRLNPKFIAFYASPSEGLAYGNPVLDLGVGGVFVRTSRPLPEGTTFEILLTDRVEPTWVRTMAEVVWTGRKNRHRGMGLRFSHTRGSLVSMRELVAAL